MNLQSKYDRVIKNYEWRLAEYPSAEGHQNSMYDLVLSSLKNVKESRAKYEKSSLLTKQYLAELDSFVIRRDEELRRDTEKLRDSSFGVFETITMLSRESGYVNGGCNAIEGEVCSYFENSGNWNQDDGTLVSATYYKELPDAYESENRLSDG